MWSKQADARTNANVTSFKSKITNRKQKNPPKPNQSPAAAPATTEKTSESDSSTATTPGKKQQKSGKHRNRKKPSTSSSTNDPAKEPAAAPALPKKVEVDEIISSEDLEMADVVLRSTAAVEDDEIEQNYKKCHVKRYSDSFVVENGSAHLSRAMSGFLVPDVPKKGRRFSDIFRQGVLKATNSMENLNFTHQNSKPASKKVDKKIEIDAQKDAKKKTSSNNKQTLKDAKNAKNAEKSNNTVPNTESSYLKRVKSKIYNKTNKNDDLLPSKTSIVKNKNCESIPEGAEPELKKSNFDFRLIRQTSNLEQIRSKAFGPFKSGSNDEDIKPKLTKAKSSSAINLNLLRTRRNRILEQLKERRTKDVLNEFEFIAFGGFCDKFGGSSQRISGIPDDTSLQSPSDRITLELGTKTADGLTGSCNR